MGALRPLCAAMAWQMVPMIFQQKLVSNFTSKTTPGGGGGAAIWGREACQVLGSASQNSRQAPAPAQCLTVRLTGGASWR